MLHAPGSTAIFRGIWFAESDWRNSVGISAVVKISGEINRDADLILASDPRRPGRPRPGGRATRAWVWRPGGGKLAEPCSAGRVRTSFDFAQAQPPPLRGRRVCRRGHLARFWLGSTIARGEELSMAIFNEPHGRVIDANSGSVLRLLGIAAAAFVVVIMLFASVARVDSGQRWSAHAVWAGDRRRAAGGSPPDQSLQVQP